MEIANYLKRQEGKTLEFKENCQSLTRILRTAVAFANTAGGTLVVAVRDNVKFKHVVRIMDQCRAVGFTKIGLSNATNNAEEGV